jgi:hypothetical protein
MASQGTSDVLELLASLPAPEAILALQPSEQLQRRIDELVEKEPRRRLERSEEAEWERTNTWSIWFAWPRPTRNRSWAAS